MSRILVCLLALCVTVLAVDEDPVSATMSVPAVPLAAVQETTAAPAAPAVAAAVVTTTAAVPQAKNMSAATPTKIVDNYDRFNLEEDLAKERPSMDQPHEHKADTMSDEPHVHVNLKPEDIVPTYDVSSAVNTSEAGMNETTTKKTYIMRIPTTPRSPLMDAMTNKTHVMQQDAPAGGMGKTTAAPSVTGTSSHLVGNHTTDKPKSASSASFTSPALVTAVLVMLGSRLC